MLHTIIKYVSMEKNSSDRAAALCSADMQLLARYTQGKPTVLSMSHTRHVRFVYLSNWAQIDELTNFTYVRTNAEGAAIKDCCGLAHLKRSMVLAIYQTSLWITERQETITV